MCKICYFYMEIGKNYQYFQIVSILSYNHRYLLLNKCENFVQNFLHLYGNRKIIDIFVQIVSILYKIYKICYIYMEIGK